MTLLMLLLDLLLGALLAWPCWLLLRRAQRARQPLRCGGRGANPVVQHPER